MKIFVAGISDHNIECLQKAGLQVIYSPVHYLIRDYHTLVSWLAAHDNVGAILIGPKPLALLESFPQTEWFLGQNPKPYLFCVGDSSSKWDHSQMRARLLDAGWDDCLWSPLEVTEFVASLGAMVRRHERQSLIEKVIVRGSTEIRICPATRLVKVNGNSISFTSKEFDFLVLLAGKSPCILSRKDVMNGLYSPEEKKPGHRIIDVWICKIRREFKRYPDLDGLIISHWGVGYQIRE
jgi:Transcriptional regulatory protein, C terminal